MSLCSTIQGGMLVSCYVAPDTLSRASRHAVWCIYVRRMHCPGPHTNLACYPTMPVSPHRGAMQVYLLIMCVWPCNVLCAMPYPLCTCSRRMHPGMLPLPVHNSEHTRPYGLLVQRTTVDQYRAPELIGAGQLHSSGRFHDRNLQRNSCGENTAVMAEQRLCLPQA